MIEFSLKAYEKIIKEAKEGKPYEVCGILGGWKKNRIEKNHKTNAKIEEIYGINNVSETPRINYLMDSEEQLNAIEEIEKKGELVGFYHSHPEGPYAPSETDKERANWPGHYYVIVSLSTINKGRETELENNEKQKGDVSVGSWRWTGKEFIEEKIKVTS